ncbi:MAG: hypothetical protein QOJ69_2379 [Actinomycetota bacterium]|jgi:hypothetical protein|nr:hypothetical protein [Actinomycetota bacterium]MEA2844708.1 hypothetical protein [Actinomycetota bacterium]
MSRPTRQSLLRSAIRLGVFRGVLRGSKLWLYIGVTAWGLRFFGRMATRKPVVLTERLNPGERMLITHFKRNQA